MTWVSPACQLASPLGEAQPIMVSFRLTYTYVSGPNEEIPTNVWIEEHHLPGLRDTAQNFMGECTSLKQKAHKALALGMGLPPSTFIETHTTKTEQLRLAHCKSDLSKQSSRRKETALKDLALQFSKFSCQVS